MHAWSKATGSVEAAKKYQNKNNFYQELFKTKRYGEDKTYNRIGKDYQLLDIIYNKEKYFKNR